MEDERALLQRVAREVAEEVGLGRHEFNTDEVRGALGLVQPSVTTPGEHNAFRLMEMRKLDVLRERLAREHRIIIVADSVPGFRVIPARDVADFAIGMADAEIRKGIARARWALRWAAPAGGDEEANRTDAAARIGHVASVSSSERRAWRKRRELAKLPVGKPAPKRFGLRVA